MTIHANQQRARRDYRCETCHSKIPAGAHYWRLYGMADAGDRPYAIKTCVTCFERSPQTEHRVGVAQGESDAR